MFWLDRVKTGVCTVKKAEIFSEMTEIMSNQAENLKTIRFRALIAALCGMALFIGCSKKPPRVYKVAYTKPNSAEQMVNGSAMIGAGGGDWVNTSESGRYLVKSTMNGVSASTEYHLGPGDELEIRVWQLLELDQSDVQRPIIDDQGQIYLTVLNKVQAEGLTIEQLRQHLAERLVQEFIKNPEISITVTKYRSKEVVVLGSVRKPGTVYLRTDNASLLDVISLADGITNNPAPNIEILRNAGNADPSTWNSASPQTYFHRDVVPVSSLYAEGGSQNNPVIFPGDVVKINNSEEGYVYVSGEVMQPGTKPYRRPLGIMQAITSSGGLNTIAEEKEIKIVRRLSSGHEQTIMVDLKKVRLGEHRNIQLAQNDLVVVPYNPDKKFWHDIGSFFRAGVNTGVTVGYDAARGQPSGGGGF